MDSLNWARPSFANLHPNMVNFMEYNRDVQLQRFKMPRQARGLKILCDIDRICDVEDSVYEWHKFNFKSGESENISVPLQMQI